MKIYDIILIFILFACSFVPLLFFPQYKSKTAVVTIDNQQYKTIDLNSPGVFEITTDKGTNIVEVKDNSISVIYADCKDNVCVKSGDIKKSGEIIACIPHKLLIEISDEND